MRDLPACPRCGRIPKPNALFCGWCGRKTRSAVRGVFSFLRRAVILILILCGAVTVLIIALAVIGTVLKG